MRQNKKIGWKVLKISSDGGKRKHIAFTKLIHLLQSSSGIPLVGLKRNGIFIRHSCMSVSLDVKRAKKALKTVFSSPPPQ